MYEITDMDHFGRGITRIDGKIVFVNGALPGEIVELDIIENKKKYMVANVKSIKNESINRVKVECPYYNECGGCDLLHLSYGSQLEYKKNKVKNIFYKYVGLNIDPEIISSPNKAYRNKVVFHKGKQGYGLYKKNSHDIVYIDECLLLDNKLNGLQNSVSLDEDITFRLCDGEVISNIFEKSEGFKTINNLKFKLNINSFFQVNDFICSKLFDFVSSFVSKDDEVLDLYAGVGTLSLVAAINAKKVYSIEINEYASSNALENVKLNNRENVEVINGDVPKILKNFGESFNTVIVDPPRSGLDEFTREFLLEKLPNKILYVSCDPLTLARDIDVLKQKYNIENITLLDMFPNTYHVETVCVLKKKSA